MRISKEQLQKIIAEEVRAHVKKKLVSESVSKPRTIKATPAMLKRIIAEEAARINEMRDGDEDSYTYGGMYSDKSYDDLQDEWAEDAAHKEAARKKVASEKELLYKANVGFYMLNPSGRLEDYNTGEVLLDLSIGAYNGKPGAPLDPETQKKIDCVSKLKREVSRQKRMLSIDQYLEKLVDCLRECGIIDQSHTLGNFMWVD